MSPSKDQPEHEEMEIAKRYILVNLSQPPNIAEIARHIYQSESSLKRKFKSVYGVPVYQFIQHSRIMKAKELLDSRQYNVKETAFKVGYSNASHFSKAFKKYVGVNPKRYLSIPVSVDPNN